MDWIDALILGIVQGLTEFLPVSSSGHLVLGEHYLGLEVAELLSFDVLVHMGTLLAILIYFWKDVGAMMKSLGKFGGALLGSSVGKDDESVKMIGWILIGSVPAVIAGFTLEDWISMNFRSVASVGVAMILVAFVFSQGECVYRKRFSGKGAPSGLDWKKVIWIGIAQAFALIPGVSRSGSTIVAGIFQGISREEAARFSFLLGIPVMAGAGLITALKMDGAGAEVSGLVLLVGFLAAFVSGLGAVSFLMKFLKKNSLLVFAAYLFVVGIGAVVLH